MSPAVTRHTLSSCRQLSSRTNPLIDFLSSSSPPPPPTCRLHHQTQQDIHWITEPCHKRRKKRRKIFQTNKSNPSILHTIAPNQALPEKFELSYMRRKSATRLLTGTLIRNFQRFQKQEIIIVKENITTFDCSPTLTISIYHNHCRRPYLMLIIENLCQVAHHKPHLYT